MTAIVNVAQTARKGTRLVTIPQYNSTTSLTPEASSTRIIIIMMIIIIIIIMMIIIIIIIIITIIIIIIIIIITLLVHPIKKGLPIPITIKCNINI